LTGSSDADAAQPEVTVLLVDPHPKLRAALASVLAAEPGIAVLDAVGSLEEALAAVRRHRPQVALVDVGALGRWGIAGLAELRAARSLMAVLTMGVVDGPAFEREAVRHGAVGRVLKDMPAAELADVIRSAARRGARLRIVRPGG
jgi:two-component system response regulator DesR